MGADQPNNAINDERQSTSFEPCSILQELKQQFGIYTSANVGLFSIDHPDAEGVADQYWTGAGLSLLLLRYHTKKAFRVATTAMPIPIYTLFITAHKAVKDDHAVVDVTTEPLTLELPAQAFCHQIVLCVSHTWLLAHLPAWVATRPATLFGQLQQAIDRDTVLVSLLKEEVNRFWQSYPSRPLKGLFVWMSVYNMLVLLFERILYKRKNKLSLFSYIAPDSQRVEMVHHYLTTNLPVNALNVSALARMAGLSQSKFNRLFKELYQVSVSEFIRTFRLQAARDLLATRQYTLSQVAEKAGFSDSLELTKLFQKKYGVLPNSFFDTLP